MKKIVDKKMDETLNVYENVIEFLTIENDKYFETIYEMKNDKLFSYEWEIQCCYDILKLNHDFFKRLNETYKNNEIKYIIRLDDYFIVYLKNDVVHSYMIYDDVDENDNEFYTTLFECDEIETYKNFEQFLLKYDFEIIK